MTTVPTWSDSEETEEAPPKLRATRKKKRTPPCKGGKRDDEEIDTCGLTALAWRAARYRETAGLAVAGMTERQTVRASVRAGMADDEVREVARRVFEVYRER
ncbi:hypothetical protein [Geodermatophilus obscurus]|uniref:Uncharacterized protein n=1 Tax=Geodermatophilus obscurus (strain ATCC 25078 / DSM 43160 / JCM 3152 / CCUG 61914 / KCC A-0152 / KCTC 9177 / NBRC 13315 / NRRL B-3577 / G-20) TaxID=526225 RepID=D2SC68_GEOOG|nr:hypothetical protein [Geodermatophilus obscurus]ADB74236.1 hypothetical protein Gobs_1508 [Geodermatophilus obscurus DSM 43160]